MEMQSEQASSFVSTFPGVSLPGTIALHMVPSTFKSTEKLQIWDWFFFPLTLFRPRNQIQGHQHTCPSQHRDTCTSLSCQPQQWLPGLSDAGKSLPCLCWPGTCLANSPGVARKLPNTACLLFAKHSLQDWARLPHL